MRFVLAAVLALVAAGLVLVSGPGARMEPEAVEAPAATEQAGTSAPPLFPALDEPMRVTAERKAEPAGAPPTIDSAAKDGIAGRVVTSTGDPVPALKIRLQHAAAGETKGYSLQKAKRARLTSEVGPGELQVDTETAIDGSFAAAGLAPGAYVVRAHANAYEHPSVFGVNLTPEQPIAVGAQEARVLFDGGFVVVRLWTAGGTPWPGEVSVPGRWRKHAPPAWPAGAHIQMVEAIRHGERWVAKGAGRPSLVEGFPAGLGAVRFSLEPNTNYLLSVIGVASGGDGFDGAPQHVAIEEGQAYKQLNVSASPLGPFGTLAVSATSRLRESGIRLPFVDLGGPDKPRRPKRPAVSPLHVDRPDTVLLVEHRPSGVVLVEAKNWTSDRFQFELPEGPYRIVVRAELARPTGQAGARHGGATRDVDISPARSAAVHLNVGEGGQVDVDIAEGEESVYLELVQPSGRSEPFTWIMPNMNGGCTTNWWWPSGKSTLSQPLPAGAYRLRGHRGFAKDGGTRYDVPVTITDGEVVRIRLE